MRRASLPWTGLVLAMLLASPLSGPVRAGSEDAPGAGENPEDRAAHADALAYGATPEVFVPFARSNEPYRRFYLTSPLYHGPGRDKPAPPALSSIRIGLMLPADGSEDEPAGRNLRDGVELAFEEANAGGGYRGLPIEAVVRHDSQLWGSAASTLTKLAYEEGVWAVIGSIDSGSTHVALRAAFKAEVAIVNVGSGDPTVTETGVPWIMRCTPDDRQTGYTLARVLLQEMGLTRVAVLRANNRYGRFGVREFRDAARRLGQPLPLEIQFHPGEQDLGAALDRLAETDVEAVVLWAGASDAGRIVRQMRRRGMKQLVAGTDRLVSERFLRAAGAAATGTLATSWFDPHRDDVAWTAFQRRFMQRFDRLPDAFAAYGYDAATLTVAAVREAGLNRVRIRDALMALRTHDGVAGPMRLNETSNSISPLVIGRVEGQRFVFDIPTSD